MHNPPIPQHMTAIEISQPGGPEVLRPARRPTPVPQGREVLIRVQAAGVNGPDVLQRKGLYDPPPGASDIPGLEIAGEVVALGDGASHLRIGDQVMALIPGGGYAEYAVADERNALLLPKGLKPTEAAALLETFMTVWTNLFQRGQFKRGESVLIHGGASGIGTTATMLARAFGASTVITTIRNEEQRQVSLALGADVAINYQTENFVEAALAATAGKGVDVVVDIIGGDYVSRNYQAAAMNGRIVQIGLLNGSAREVDLFPMLTKRLTHLGSTLRSRSHEEKAAIMAELQTHVWPLIESGRIKPRVSATFGLRQASDAHRLLDTGGHIGKVVLTV